MPAGGCRSRRPATRFRRTDDRNLAETCRSLGLCLVTADLDFAQILDFPPDRYPGIIVLRHPYPTLLKMRELVRQVAITVARESPAGRLWIVEPGRVRIHGDS
jgi:Domain of unknown function (DUF5615)